MTRSSFRLLAASAIALTSVPAIAQQMGPFDPARLSAIDKTISDDSFEGRGPATRAETKTINYIADALKAAGVQPGGDTVNGQRSWFQNVPLLQSSWSDSPKMTLSLPGKDVPLTQGEQIAARAPMTGVKGLDLNHVQLVFAGYGVKAPERNWDDFKGQDMHGKIMVVLVNDPDFEGGEGDFGGKAMTYYGRWTYKYGVAQKIRDRHGQFFRCGLVLHITSLLAQVIATDRSRFPTSAVRSWRARSNARGRCESAA